MGSTADERAAIFNQQRVRLRGIAYRMLGSLADAEDVVQDVWLRLNESTETFKSTQAWLVTVTTRLSIDRLRTLRIQRESYIGLWLPEPALSESPPTPEQLLERANDISTAFLILLERLDPEARAAFLLREVFDADYAQVAETIGKSEGACRQIVHRAKAQMNEGRQRHVVSPALHLQLLRKFAEALAHGDFASLVAMLTHDAEFMGDGGGRVPSLGKPLFGAQRIAQLFYATYRRFGAAIRVEPVVFNGQWGLVRFVQGELESAQSVETDGAQITRIHVQRNPEKLARLAAALDSHAWREPGIFWTEASDPPD